jgi:hypothetical protein
MSQETERHELTKKRVVYQMPGTEAVTIRRDVPYRETDAGMLTLDIYYPPEAQSGARLPAVIFVVGYSDLGAQALLGCKFKEMDSFISWAQLVARSGVVAITYSTGREPGADVHALLAYVREHAADLMVDEHRLGLWACSGHVPNALSVLMQEGADHLQCAVLCYGYMLDSEGTMSVADAAKTFRFVNPCAGRSINNLPTDTPLFIVRAGRDEMPRLNETIDRFMAEALSRNLPLTFVNHKDAPHAFDLMYDSDTSREIIRQILAFMRFQLLADGG